MHNGKRQKATVIDVEESSGNVFADLGLPNAEKLLAKAKLISKIHTAMDEDGLSDEVTAGMIGIAPRHLDKILRGDLDRYSLRELTSMHRDLNAIRAKLKVFDELVQRAKDKVAEVNPLVKTITRTKGLEKGRRVVIDAPHLHYDHDREGSGATYFDAAIQIPQGVGVLSYYLGAGKNLQDSLDYTVITFIPFQKCKPELQAKLAAFVDELATKLNQEVPALASAS